MHLKIDLRSVELPYARPLDTLETLIWMADEAMMASIQLEHPQQRLVDAGPKVLVPQ